MADATTLNLVAAAAMMVGPMGDMSQADWQAEVLDSTLALYAMAADNGPVGKYMGGIARVEAFAADPNSKKGKIFVATIKEGYRERSGRGVIVLTKYNETAREWKDENVRTDFLNNDDGIGQRLFSLAARLKGHKVLVWVELEDKTDGSGQTVRMIRHIEDRGEDQAFADAA